MTYRSFTISDNPHGLRKIYRNGKQVFTARHHECWTLETAKQLIDDSLEMRERQDKRVEKKRTANHKKIATTPYESWHLNKFGYCIPEPEVEEEDFGLTVSRREDFVYVSKEGVEA